MSKWYKKEYIYVHDSSIPDSDLTLLELANRKAYLKSKTKNTIMDNESYIKRENIIYDKHKWGRNTVFDTRKYQREYHAKQREFLTDYYMKCLINCSSGIKFENITDEIVSLKRTLIIAKRYMWEYKNER